VPGAANRFLVAYPTGYPTTTNVLLWDVTSTTVLSELTVVSEPGDHNQVSLAADAQGRIWVFWTHTETDGPHVFARRIGTGGLEPVIDLGAPARTNAIYAIDGAVDPSGDPEVLALAGLSNGTYQRSRPCRRLSSGSRSTPRSYQEPCWSSCRPAPTPGMRWRRARASRR
jgi:hypothetical protein